MKIKIAYLISTLNTGGAENQLIRTINLLDKEKFLVKVFVLSDKVDLIDNLNDVDVEILNINYRQPFAIPKVLKTIHSFSPHILHSVMYASNLMARFYKLYNKKCKIVNHVHGLGSWIKKRHILLDRFFLRCVDKIILVSQTSKSLRLEREKYPVEKTVVIYNSVNTNEFINLKKTSNTDTIILGTASRLVNLKQVDKLLLLFKKIRDLKLDVVLKIAGSGPEQNRLRTIVDELNLNDYVSFMGNLTDMPIFYNSIDVFVLYSRIEDLPLTIVEAFSSGLPVIAPKIGGIPELITDNDGLLIDASSSVDDQAGQIANFILENNLKDLSLNNRKFAKNNFDSKIHKASVEYLYENLTHYNF